MPIATAKKKKIKVTMYKMWSYMPTHMPYPYFQT